jgi:hypothetical protein
MDSAIYLYCVVRSAKKPRADRAPAGLPGSAKPRAVPAGRSLWLVVSEVPLETYGPARLDTALRDLDWVAQIAVAHEAIVEHFATLRGTAVVPMKLFTMFSTEARAVSEMETRRTHIDRVLKRISGCEEWGVRVMRGAQRPTAIQPTDGRSGTAFLTARKAVRDTAREAVAKANVAAATVFDALAPIARDARRRNDSPAGAVPPLLDAAFLVPAGKRARFRTAARRVAKVCAQAGAEMTLTGPWPAYNFVQSAEERA